jgi:hypothetical protein
MQDHARRLHLLEDAEQQRLDRDWSHGCGFVSRLNDRSALITTDVPNGFSKV